MRKVVVLIALVAVASLGAISAPAAQGAGCRLLSDRNAERATEEDEVLKDEHRAGNGNVVCRFDTGPSEPASVPPEARTRVQLDLQLFLFTGKAMQEVAADICTLVHKGNYPEDACTFLKRAVKVDDPLLRMKLVHRAYLDLGTAERVTDFGTPAFLAELKPPLVGTELWIYLEDQKKVLVVTCIELRTAGKLPDNAHFPTCAFAAAHAALVKLR
jgi:hypothetical protein